MHKNTKDGILFIHKDKDNYFFLSILWNGTKELEVLETFNNLEEAKNTIHYTKG